MMFGFVLFATFLWTPHSTHALDLPLQLASQQNTNASADTLRLGDTPNPFIYYPTHDHKIVFERKAVNHRDAGASPAMSVSNWNHAVSQAGRRARAIQEEALVGVDALVSGNHFWFENTLAHPFSRHVSQPRRIRFDFYGRGGIDLRFVHVHVLLNGMSHYGKIFVRPERVDLVRMCNITMYWLTAGIQYESAGGSAKLIIPSEPGAIAAS